MPASGIRSGLAHTSRQRRCWGSSGWMQGGRRRDLVFGVGAAAGAVATLSRGAISSIAIGIAASIMSGRADRHPTAVVADRRRGRRRGVRGGYRAVVRASHQPDRERRRGIVFGGANHRRRNRARVGEEHPMAGHRRRHVRRHRPDLQRHHHRVVSCAVAHQSRDPGARALRPDRGRACSAMPCGLAMWRLRWRFSPTR